MQLDFVHSQCHQSIHCSWFCSIPSQSAAPGSIPYQFEEDSDDDSIRWSMSESESSDSEVEGGGPGGFYTADFFLKK